MERELNIVHLYPDLLNLYGDKGNIACMQKRLNWRGIATNITECMSKTDDADIENADIIFLGGGSDREQEIVSELLLKKQDRLKAYVENNGVFVAICGGYQLLGKYYKTADTTIEGLNILDIYTEFSDKRLISNTVIESNLFPEKTVGFENHAGRTYIGNHTPFGKVLFGFGNTDDGGYEGVIYKNVIGTYLHGPLLPKNPMLCDYILTNALKRKYPDFTELEPLDDTIENVANNYITNRFTKGL